MRGRESRSLDPGVWCAFVDHIDSNTVVRGTQPHVVEEMRIHTNLEELRDQHCSSPSGQVHRRIPLLVANVDSLQDELAEADSLRYLRRRSGVHAIHWMHWARPPHISCAACRGRYSGSDSSTMQRHDGAYRSTRHPQVSTGLDPNRGTDNMCSCGPPRKNWLEQRSGKKVKLKGDDYLCPIYLEVGEIIIIELGQ